MAKDQWDEALRGKKMSEQTGLTIYKYQIPVLEEFTMELPKGAKILRIADQDGMFWLWALVDIREPDETRHFRAFKCGAPISDDIDIDSLIYYGWAAVHVQQELALYIFEEVKQEEVPTPLIFTEIKDNISFRIEHILEEYLGILDLDYGATLINDYELDSLDIVEFIMILEEEFNIEIPDKDFDSRQDMTIQGVIDYIRNKTT